MILYRISFKHRHVHWIMECITSASMAVLINGELTNFLKIKWALREGCALSPLLFTLVMDAFNRGINTTKEVGAIKGCGIYRNCHLSHLLFVDDIICARTEKNWEWETFHKIFQNFNKAPRLKNNKDKTECISDDGDLMELKGIASMFEVNICSLSNGFKYLGCHLKPCNYKSSDWDWLVDKFEKMLYRWDHRWLTIRGMALMIQAVFQGIPTYWMHIFHIP